MTRKDQIASTFMLLPVIIIFTTFFIAPLLYTAYFSFSDWNNYSPSVNLVGLKNYLAVFSDKQILIGIQNSLVYAICTVILQNVISLPIAVLLCSKIPGRNIFRTIFFTPAVLSTLVVGYLFSFILSSQDFGLLNEFLNLLGLNSVSFLGDPRFALASIIGTQVWQWFGWSMVIYIANIQNIPTELYEAADLDGANSMQKFFKITLPNLAPSLKINLITGMISGLKVFDIVFSLTKGGPGYSTETILSLMFSKFSEGNYAYAAAFGMVFLVVTMILTSIVMTIFRRWERTLA